MDNDALIDLKSRLATFAERHRKEEVAARQELEVRVAELERQVARLLEVSPGPDKFYRFKQPFHPAEG